MKIIPSWVKTQLKKSTYIVRLHRWLHWQLYLFKDLWGTKIWRQTKEVVTPLGFRLNSGFHPAYKMMREGTFEVEETKLMKDWFERVDVFVDVGANLGYYSCLAKMSGKHVISVEPQPQNLKCLIKNLKANGWGENCEIFPLALSCAPGILTLFGASGPSASLISDWAGYSSYYKQHVPTTTLDIIVGDRLAEKKIFIKIDVEGAEADVLAGAVATLSRTIKPVWLIEICASEFYPSGFNPRFKETFDLFFGLGYSCYAVARELRAVHPADVDKWVQTQCAASGTINYFFVDEVSQGRIPIQ